jgi:hypothetical protein
VADLSFGLEPDNKSHLVLSGGDWPRHQYA